MTTPIGGSRQPEESFASAGQGTLMLGVNQLQKTIDKFDQAVEKLTKLYDKQSASGGAFGQASGSQASPTGMLGWTPNFGTYGPSQPTTGPHGVAPQVPGGTGPQTNAGSGNGQGFAPSLAQQFSGGYSGGGSTRQGFMGMTRPTTAMAGVGMVAASAVGYGKQQFPGQVGFSSYVQQQQLNMPLNQTGQAAGNAIRFSAVGGGGQNLNVLAQSSGDALGGQAIISAVAGVPIARFSALGRNISGSAAAIGYANPGQSYTQSAQMAGQAYMPGTSLNMRMMGVQTTPLNIGGGSNSMAAVNASVMQRIYGANKVSPARFAATMAQGRVGNLDITQMYGAQAAPGMIAELAAQNRFPGTAGQFQKLVNQASRGNSAQTTRAQDTLAKYGIDKSDEQQIKNLGAIKTGRSSDVANSFTAGLTAATTGLIAFNNGLTKFIDIPAINKLVGGAGGLGGTVSNLANPGNMLSTGMGLYGMMTLLKGGGGAAGAGGLLSKLGLGGGGGGGTAAAGGVSDAVIAGEAAPEAAGMAGVIASMGGVGAMIGPLALVVASLIVMPKVLNAVEGVMKNTVGKVPGLKSVLDPGANLTKQVKKDPAKLASLPETLAQYPANTADTWIRRGWNAVFAEGGVTGFAAGGVPYATGIRQGTADMVGGGVAMGGMDTGKDTLTVKVRPGEGILIPEATAGIGGPNTIKALNAAFKGKNLGGGGATAGSQTESSLMGFAEGGVTGNHSPARSGHPASSNAGNKKGAKPSSGSVSGSSVAAYAKSFATGKNHPYVWGGATPQGWDCSGFAAYVYNHFGFFGGAKSGTRDGDVKTMVNSPYVTKSHDQPGALVDFVTDGTVQAPGHIGISMGGGKYAGADDPAVGTVIASSSGALGFFIPKKGFAGGKASGSSGSGGSGAPSGGGTGLTSGTETDVISAALGGSAGGAETASAAPATPTSTSSAPSGAGGFAGAGALGTGVAIGKYMMKAGYSKIASAAAAGSSYGESSWNPEAVEPGLVYPAKGDGNGGLIGWSPPSGSGGGGMAYYHIQQTGHPSSDFAQQLGKMVDYYNKNSPAGFKNYSGSLMGAEQIVDSQIERAGISDIKDAQARQVLAKLGTGGTVKRDGAYILGERGPEEAWLTAGSHITSAKRTAMNAQRRPNQTHWATTVMAQGAHHAGDTPGTITFNDGAIQINMNSTDQVAVSRASREIARQTAQLIQDENMLNAIATGVS